MYSLNEKVVYPGHGVAKINRIVEKNISNKTATFYELKFLNKEMTILVPTDNFISVGIRKLSSDENINYIFQILSEPVKKINSRELNSSSWNKRSKQYQFKLRSGDLLEISKIYRDLQYIAQQKELSFGERALLQQTEMLLAEEISLVKNLVEEKAVEQLRSFFNHKTQNLPVSQNSQRAYL